MHPVRLTKLTLTGFRNYTYAQMSCPAPFVVLVGGNGAGKTNVLEAISYLAPGRGLRKVPLGAVVTATSAGPWAVAATVEDGTNPPVILSTGLDPDAFAQSPRLEKRIARIDGVPLKNLTDFEEHIRLFWLLPTMDALFRDSPSVRRGFLDRLIERWDPHYAAYLTHYEHLMRQRMALLKSQVRGLASRSGATWLEGIEHQMAAAAMAVLAARHAYGDMLNRSLQEGLGLLPPTVFQQNGDLESQLQTSSLRETEAFMAAALAANRTRDGEQGTTRMGPHVTNFQGRHPSKNLYADQCSTGEVKIMLLNLILAAARLESLRWGRTPILLLDEVMVHLDATFRQHLAHELAALNAQCFFTGTDASMFHSLEHVAPTHTLQIDHGRLC